MYEIYESENQLGYIILKYIFLFDKAVTLSCLRNCCTTASTYTDVLRILERNFSYLHFQCFILFLYQIKCDLIFYIDEYCVCIYTCLFKNFDFLKLMYSLVTYNAAHVINKVLK